MGRAAADRARRLRRRAAARARAAQREARAAGLRRRGRSSACRSASRWAASRVVRGVRESGVPADPSHSAARVDPARDRLARPRRRGEGADHLVRRVRAGRHQQLQRRARDRAAPDRGGADARRAPRDVVREVLIPGALPMIFTGLRLSMQACWTTLVAGELIGAIAGLGHVLYQASLDIFPAMIIVGMAAVAHTGAAMTALLGWIEKRAMPWRSGVTTASTGARQALSLPRWLALTAAGFVAFFAVWWLHRRRAASCRAQFLPTPLDVLDAVRRADAIALRRLHAAAAPVVELRPVRDGLRPRGVDRRAARAADGLVPHARRDRRRRCSTRCASSRRSRGCRSPRCGSAPASAVPC